MPVRRLIRRRTLWKQATLIGVIAGWLVTATPGADKTWPPVLYVVDFHKDALNTKVVDAIRSCCESQARAVAAHPNDLGCPNRLSSCEILRLNEDDTGTKYMIENEYLPKDPLHPQLMEKRLKYGARDEQGKALEILKLVRYLVTCHELPHRRLPDPRNPEEYCQRCGSAVAAPVVPARTP